MLDQIHPGYEADGFSTKHGLRDYNQIHELDFLELIRKLRLEKGRILDNGCGNGVFLEQLQEHFPEIQTIGVDFKPYASRIKDFRVADARSLPVDSSSVNLVVSTCVSQWIKSRKQDFYREISRVLAPKGYAYIFPFNTEDLPVDLDPTRYVSLRRLHKGLQRIPVDQLILYAGRSRSL